MNTNTNNLSHRQSNKDEDYNNFLGISFRSKDDPKRIANEQKRIEKKENKKIAKSEKKATKKQARYDRKEAKAAAKAKGGNWRKEWRTDYRKSQTYRRQIKNKHRFYNEYTCR